MVSVVLVTPSVVLSTVSGVIASLGLDPATEQALRRRLDANGIAGLEDLAKVSETQMREMLGIVKLGHRRKISLILQGCGFTSDSPKVSRGSGNQARDRPAKS